MLNCRRFCVIIHVITLTIIKITISYKYDDDDNNNNKRFGNNNYNKSDYQGMHMMICW